MALQKLPKQYHPDFRLPNKKPVGEVALDAKHSLFDSTLFDAEFINGNAIDLVTGRQLTNVGATWGVTGEQGTQYTANSHYAFSGLEKLSGNDFTVIVRARIDAYGSNGTIPIGWNNNGSAFFQIGDGGNLWVAGRSATPQRAFDAADGVYRDYIFIADAGSNQVKVYFDDELLGQRSGAASVSAGSKDIKIGKWVGGSNWPLEGGISRIQVLNKSLSDSEVRAYVKNRYSILKPQNDPVYFTSDAAGGSITVSPTLGTISYSGNATTIGLFGSIDVTATLGAISYAGNNTTVGLFGVVDVSAGLGSISYTSNNATIQVSGAIEVNPTLGAISYTSNATSVQVSGSVDVTATLGTISYTSNNTVVDLGGAITVAAGLGTINYVSNDTIVGLAGQIGINATLGTISYTSNNTIVIASNGQSIGDINTSFAGDLYGSNFKPNSITVTFRG